MALLSIANLSHAFGDLQILEGVNLTVEHGEHVALVGRNGCGKSTLLKIVAGLSGYRHDEGQVQLARGATAGYLAQEPELDPGRTLREEAAAAFEGLHRLHERLDELTHRMADAGGDQLDSLLQEYESVQQKVEAAGGYAVDHRIEATLHGLGLGDETFDVRVDNLSGGQKGRLALAKLLLQAPDLLLLDEPTNHLDIEGRRWLEQFLAEYRGAVILISHDRWLLDRVVTRIYELDRGRLEEYPGNYTQYRQLRAERLEVRRREYEKQQQSIKREQAFIDKYRAGQRAKQAAGREKRLQRYIRDETVEKPLSADEMSMRLPPAKRSGDMVLAAEAVTKGYENKPLFDSLDLMIRRGDRIGVIGPNGIGKSTLIKCLLGEMDPDRGHVRLGAQVDPGHFRQGQQHLDREKTVVEYLKGRTSTEQEARDLAGAFLFSGDEQDRPLGEMSGGERVRTELAGLVAGGHNLLVLDEPTNHLDIPSAERLEGALAAYTKQPKGYGSNATGGGTLLLITHDRMLLENLVDQLIIFEGTGTVRLFQGSYSEYLASLQKPAAEGSAASPASKANGGKNGAGKKSGPGKKDQPRSPGSGQGTGRGTATTDRKKSKGRGGQSAGGSSGSGALELLSESKLEQRIMELERERDGIDAQLADPSAYQDPEAMKRLQARRQELTAEIQPLEAEWERRAAD